jgi:transposase
MGKQLVSDELWQRIEPLLPPERPRRFRFPGRKPLDRRKVLSGIIFVLKSGISWDDLPAELGWGCGRTCRETLAAWQQAGVWQKLHELLLAELNAADHIDWSRVLIDSATVKAPKGGDQTGPNPTDRRKKGSKHHLATDAEGIPLATKLTGANRHDVTQLIPLIDAIPAVCGRRGRPRRRPGRAQADRADDSEEKRQELRRRGIKPVLARRNTEHGSGLGVYRWFVERTLSWAHQFRRLAIRWDPLPEIQSAWLSLACCLICLRLLLQTVPYRFMGWGSWNQATLDVALWTGMREGIAWPRRSASKHEARYSKTFRPCCRRVATTVSIRSPNRLPCTLSVPPLIRRQITACRNARSTALFVGATPLTRAKVHRASSTLRISKHVAAVFAHEHFDPSRRACSTSRRKRRIRS